MRETLAGTPQGGVISPPLTNIYLNKLDRIWAARYGQLYRRSCMSIFTKRHEN